MQATAPYGNALFRATTKGSGSRTVYVAVMATLLLTYLLRISWNIVDPDMWHEMALFRQVLAHGAFPVSDPFAYTPVLARFIHHEWGAGAIAWLVAQRFGTAGILALRDVLALATGLVAFTCARRQGAQTGTLVSVSFLAVLLTEAGFSPIRGQIYTFLFTACLLYFLALDRTGSRRWIAGWLLLFVVWVNLHGGFAIALVLVGAEWLERALRREPHRHLVAVAAAMLGLVVLNPYGWAYYGFLWHALTMARPHIGEWESLWKGAAPSEIAAFVPALLLSGYAIRRTGVRGAPGIAVFLTAACGALLHNRLLPIFAIAFLSSTPGWLNGSPLGMRIETLFHRRALLVLLLLAAVGLGGFFAHRRAWMPWELKVPGAPLPISEAHIFYPVGAVDYLAGLGFHGNVMVPFDYGAYVCWKLYPAVRISVDSRYEVAFPAWLVDENVRFYAAEAGWKTILTKYATDLVLLPRFLPLAKSIAESGWRRVYVDRSFELWSRPGLSLPAADWTGRSFAGSLP